jgi:hypothetical protein
MVRVFVVLILIFMFGLSGCEKSSDIDNPNHIVDKNENIVSSIPGDFDGDKYPEYVYAANSSDGKSYIKLVDGDTISYKDLNFKLDNYSTNVQDVNSDGKDDLILYSIQENTQNVYVFSYLNDILNILNPETISNHIAFNKYEDGYKVTCGNLEETIKSKEKLDLQFYYTDLDYKEEGPVFDSVGTIITSNGKIIYTVLSTFRIDSNGKINICDLDLKPYVEVEE